MKTPRRLLGIALLVVVGLWLSLMTLGGVLSQPAPDIALTTITGEQFRISDLRGHPVLMTFWASDCRTCLLEIPSLAKLQRDFSAQGLHVIAVTMSYDMPSRVLAIAEARKLPYKVALDPLARVAEAFGRVQLVPATFLVAPDGTIQFRHVGALDFASLRSQINDLLGEF